MKKIPKLSKEFISLINKDIGITVFESKEGVTTNIELTKDISKAKYIEIYCQNTHTKYFFFGGKFDNVIGKIISLKDSYYNNKQHFHYVNDIKIENNTITNVENACSWHIINPETGNRLNSGSDNFMGITKVIAYF